MEGILWEESLAEFRVAKFPVTILIKSGHEKWDFIVCDLEAQVFQPMDQVLNTGRTSAWLIKDPKGVD